MKLKNIVKVMNLHALLRVDNSRKTAEKYFAYEQTLREFVDTIFNNRNLILDKKTLKMNRKARELNIYIANDMEFCGNFNTNIREEINRDKDSYKIIIGRKVRNDKDDTVFAMDKEQYKDRIAEIQEILYDGILNSRCKEINIIYNHYYNISKIELIKKRLYPLEDMKPKDTTKYNVDFAVEGDINDILIRIIVLYLLYEIRVCVENSYASENIMRQEITKESLKKIDEMEEERIREERKKLTAKSFQKSLEVYTSNQITEDKNEG